VVILMLLLLVVVISLIVRATGSTSVSVSISSAGINRRRSVLHQVHRLLLRRPVSVFNITPSRPIFCFPVSSRCLRISTRVLERRIKLRFVVVKHRQNRQILLLVVVVVFTALCSMVSIVKSLFLLSKSARDFFSMKEIRASRGEERAFLFVWFS
jgi:hypothetical protein